MVEKCILTSRLLPLCASRFTLPGRRNTRLSSISTFPLPRRLLGWRHILLFTMVEGTLRPSCSSWSRPVAHRGSRRGTRYARLSQRARSPVNWPSVILFALGLCQRQTSTESDNRYRYRTISRCSHVRSCHAAAAIIGHRLCCLRSFFI